MRRSDAKSNSFALGQKSGEGSRSSYFVATSHFGSELIVDEVRDAAGGIATETPHAVEFFGPQLISRNVGRKEFVRLPATLTNQTIAFPLDRDDQIGTKRKPSLL